jgi:hypothetical protein
MAHPLVDDSYREAIVKAKVLLQPIVEQVCEY